MNPGKEANILMDTALPLDFIGGRQKFAEFHKKMCGDDLQDIDDVTRATDELAV